MSPTTYISPPITVDQTALSEQGFDRLRILMPGWEPNPGGLATLIIEATAEIAAQQGELASAAATNAFRYFGLLVGLPPLDASPATGLATFALSDSAGHTIPAGTTVGLRDSNNTLQGFRLASDIVVAGGSTTGSGPVYAETAGAAQNGLSGTAQVVQAPDFVASATVTVTSAGVDAETPEVYLNRLVETLKLLSPEPILPANFAVLARSIAGVYRATAVDLLKPGPPYDGSAEATGQEKCVTVACVDGSGNSVGSTVRGLVQTYLQSLRETNFRVFVVDPQYAVIDVTVNAVCWPGYDPTTIMTAIQAALNGLLSPLQWSTDQGGVSAHWFNDPVVRQSELYETVMTVPGVRYATLTFALGGAVANLTANPNAEVDLTGISATGGAARTRDATHVYIADSVTRTQAVKIVTTTGANSGAQWTGLSWFIGDFLSAAVQVYGTSGDKVRLSLTDGTTNITGTTTLGVTGWNPVVLAGAPALATTGAGVLQVDNDASGTAETFWVGKAQALRNLAGAQGTADVTMGVGSAIPALPRPGVMNVAVTAS